MSSSSSPTSSSSAFPSYLLHAPLLSIQSPLTPSSQILQRVPPPSPLYYLHPPPVTHPGALPPSLSLSTTQAPIKGRISTVYRATSPSGTPLVLKYSTDVLALLKEAEEMFVSLPQGALPIPTFYGIFAGNVEGDGKQPKGLVTVMRDCGQPLPSGTNFDSLSLKERQYLYKTLKTLHEIHASHGSFSPSSVVVSQPHSSSSPPSSPDTTTPNSSPERELTLVGFSQAEWHLCPGENSCQELLDAKQALGL